MNLVVLLVCSYSALATIVVSEISGRNTTELWNDFKLKYGKVYASSSIESERRMIFERNLALIDNYKRLLSISASKNANDSAGGPSFTVGINDLADRTYREFSAMRGFKMPKNFHLPFLSLLRNIWAEIKRFFWKKDSIGYDDDKSSFIQSILDDNSVEVPDALDWRKVPGRVSSVKRQGNCGSCWAFAATGVLEGQQKGKLGNTSDSVDIIDLSVQNLVDCDKSNSGCGGGIIWRAFEFVRRVGGINDEKSYPYRAEKGRCRSNSDTFIMSTGGPALLPRGNEEILKHVVAKYGPVAV